MPTLRTGPFASSVSQALRRSVNCSVLRPPPARVLHLRTACFATLPPSPPPMHAFVEILGAGSPDSSSSLQLFFDEGRYLFECGDGTQRLCTEYGIKLGRLRGIFLTSLSAPSVGGLLGLGLTLADAGKDAVSITAPHGLAALFRAARPFYHRPSLASTLHEVDLEAPLPRLPLPVARDENVTIHAVPVRSRRDTELSADFGAHYDAVAYACRLRDLRGKFNPARAAALGVKRGRAFGQLQKGQSVTTDAGAVVAPADVMSRSTPGPLLLVVPCPSVDHVPAVAESPVLTPAALDVLREETPPDKPVRACVVVHLGPRVVLEHPLYRRWADSFGPAVAHIPIHASVSPRRTVFSAQAEDLSLLHFTVDKDLFPLPSDVFAPSSPSSVADVREANAQVECVPSSEAPSCPEASDRDPAAEIASDRVGKWLEADCRLKYILSPAASVGPDRTALRPRFIERKPAQPNRPWRSGGLFEQGPTGESPRATMKTPACISSLPPRAAAVRFFGTGAAIPGKHRNVSGLMIDLFERGGVMMDCGEGTWGQMVRHFGLKEAKRVLCELKVVFISHMHADHHLGLINLLHERTVALRELSEYRRGPQLVLVGPRHLASWLEAFQAVAKVPLLDRLGPTRRSFKFFDAASLTDPQAPEAKFFPDAFGLEVGCVDVVHCPLSYGLVLRDCIHGWKVVYSGDTRPCSALAEIGQGATLAIHEATLDDEMEAEAVDKLHCTTSEALDVCSTQMGAWRTILTHFSQRYPKVPKLNDQTVAHLRRNRASFSFDQMCVDFCRLEELPKIVPVLRECFPEENAPEAIPACVERQVQPV